MSEHKHWSEWLAERVIAEKKEPYVITSGITTSGPAHLGTLCEFLFPDAIRKQLEARGKKVTFYFLADILDAFDSVPVAMEGYAKELEPHLGKPLSEVPDPAGKAKSFGDHFLSEVRGLMALFGVKATVLRMSDLYAEGKFDEWARFYLQHEAEARRLVEETSGKQEKKDWSPIMPICEKCGRIATTRVVSHDSDAYEYVCDKDVKYTKGCNHRGSGRIADHRYKITWRLHWPAWKQIFGTSIEGAGMDHHTKGGSEDTCREVTNGLMKADYHIPFKYGFILFQGKKYSKSKGIGMGVSELVRLVPPEIIKYILLKPDLEENVDINPTAESMLRTMEDFQKAAELAGKGLDGLNRHERKMAIAFGLSAEKLNWRVPFLDVLLYYQIYHDWAEVAKLTGDAEGVAYLRPYIEEWVARDFMPDDYRFKYQPGAAQPGEAVRRFVPTLNDGMDALAIHNAVFDWAKANGMEPKKLFSELYQALLGKERGPRMGKLIAALGVSRVKKDLGV
ncbi:MAG: lysine--tRNA ligase [Candidatus Micrarchaeota archaeon]